MQFLTSFLLASSAVSQTVPCSNPKQAVDWKLMSSTQQNSYLTAIACVRNLPSKFNLNSAWDDLSHIHKYLADRGIIHQQPQFLPWHRVLLGLHDNLLQQCRYTGPFPYWDWAKDANAPEASYDMAQTF